jgi:hypothetical protein
VPQPPLTESFHHPKKLLEFGYEKEKYLYGSKKGKSLQKELARSAKAQEKSEIALKEQAESLKQASQITALNSLIVFYPGNKVAFSSSPNDYNYYYSKKKECIKNRAYFR